MGFSTKRREKFVFPLSTPHPFKSPAVTNEKRNYRKVASHKTFEEFIPQSDLCCGGAFFMPVFIMADGLTRRKEDETEKKNMEQAVGIGCDNVIEHCTFT